jgi:hypothetical protein
MFTLEIETPKMTVQASLEQLSLEANVLANMTGSIRRIFPELLSNLATSFAMSKDIPTVNVVHTKEQKFVLNEMNTRPYLDLAELGVQIPEGFKGSFVDYSICLLKLAKSIQSVEQTVLKPYIVYLSQFISNKESKISIKDTTHGYKTMAVARDHAITELDKFRSNSSSAKSKLGSLISRKADIPTIYNNTFLISKALSNVDLKSVQACVKNCVDLLDIIVKQVEEDKISSVTPEVAKNLAYGATEVAREVEYLSLLHYRAMAFTTSVDSITMTLSDYIRDIH